MKPTVLIVHEDERFGRELQIALRHKPYDAVVVRSAREGLSILRRQDIAVLVSDCRPKGMSGVALLAVARTIAPETKRVLLTTEASMATTAQAITKVALFRFLFKPYGARDIDNTILDAMRARREETLLTVERVTRSDDLMDRALNTEINRALESCHMIYQPVLKVCPDGQARWGDRTCGTFGYEALVRVNHPSLSNPALLISAVIRAGRHIDFDRTVRSLVAKDLAAARLDSSMTIFVNHLTTSLEDPLLLMGREPLVRYAESVVLEISEHTPLSVLDHMEDLDETTRTLRALGYRLGLDDLAGGPTGLQVFGLLKPDIVKFDMSLVRGIYQSRARSKTIMSMVKLCQKLGCLALAEQVESQREFDYLVSLGVELFQGYYIGRPTAGFLPIERGVHDQGIGSMVR